MNTKKNNYFFLIIALMFALFSVKQAFPRKVYGETFDCDDRYLTLVNPVRARNRWADSSLAPIKNQYEVVKNGDFAATWLVQYDVLKDSELVDEIKRFDDKQEIGVFLEVSEALAIDAKVIYPYAKPWTDPSALFLSGYSQSQRRKIIGKIFADFNKVFGFYPKSVGAWWIDSYSLDYIEDKYGIDTVLIVADQKTTDSYGVWGQWWGVPYYPVKYNLLKPASDINEQSDFVVIQWAQRDITKAYGDDHTYSNYSLQANDYLERGLDTEYFNGLVSDYLNCELPLGQITIGLETGAEGAAYIDEYQKQLDYLKNLEGLKSVTMSQFYEAYGEKYTANPKEIVLGEGKSGWILTTNKRVNESLSEEIDYKNIQAFSDYFIADESSFLNRRLTDGDFSQRNTRTLRVFILPSIIFFIYSLREKLFKIWVSASIFLIAGYGLLLRSGSQYGWKVFYGLIVSNLDYVNLLIATVVFLIFFQPGKYLSNKKGVNVNLLYSLFPLAFGLDTVIRLIRYTNIKGNHYLGIVLNTFDFYGFTYPDIKIVSQQLPNVVAGAMLKFNMDKIWSKPTLSIFVYPLVHILAGLILHRLFVRLKPGLRLFIMTLLTILFLGHLYYVLGADPRVVVKL